MKILMLGWELPPHYVGGMGTVCYSLSKHLAESGAEIDFILPFEADYSDIDFMRVNPKFTEFDDTQSFSYKNLQEINATVYGKVKFDTYLTENSKLISFDAVQDAFILKIRQAITQNEYDVIHAHDWLTLRGAILAKQLTGLPLFVHIHATEFDRSGADEYSYGNEMIHQIEYEGMMMADKILPVSQWTKDIIVKRYGIDPNKIEVVHNSMDLTSPYISSNDSNDNYYIYLKKMKQNGYKVVLNVGRQSIQKGLVGFIDAINLALSVDKKLIFLFVGSGDMHEELINKVAEYNLSKNVVFAGFQNGKKLRDAFLVSDLFVMPSISEPFGTTPLEAIGLGVPVLISKQSGVGELLTGAIKLDFWDTNQIADSIISITRNKSLHDELVQAGKRDFARQSWVDSAQKTMDIYRSVLGVTV